MAIIDTVVIDLPEVVGRGYATFWNFRGRYRVVKGGRGSKKSSTTAIWYIYNMMRYYEEFGAKPNLVVVRRYANTHRTSTRAKLIWAIKRLHVTHLWNIPKGDTTLTYIPSGQRILFRGLDEPENLTSIDVEDGDLCWVWCEEAYQITNEEDFNKLDLSIRGAVEYPLFKQITLTFNPWSDKTWIKQRFFDHPNKNVLAMTTTWRTNEFLDDDDKEIFREMRKNQPRRYEIEGKGNWGVSDGLVFENWKVEEFDYEGMMRLVNDDGTPVYRTGFGLDFGYTNDPTAFIAMLFDLQNYKIYIFDEIYKKKLSNKMIVQEVEYRGYADELIWADSEDPRTIEELKALGLRRIKPVKKGPGSVIAGINKLNDYEIIVHPRCVNAQVELSNYIWAKDRKTGRALNVPIDDFNHLMDAMRYGTCRLSKKSFSFE